MKECAMIENGLCRCLWRQLLHNNPRLILVTYYQVLPGEGLLVLPIAAMRNVLKKKREFLFWY